MLHTIANLPDCATCHTSAASANGFTSWAAEAIANGTNTALSTLGVFHSNISSNSLTTCQSCHSNERPVGPVGSPSFDHANGGTGDCVSCHKISGNIGLTWAGAQAVPSTVTIAPPGGSSGWPTLNVPHPTINTANAGESCTTCHGATAVSGKLIGYDHSAGFALDSSVGCFYCHGSGQKIVGSASDFSTGPLSNNTHEGSTISPTTTCQSCHEHSGTTFPNWNGSAFTGGGGI
jgi:hypothetical protein